MDEKLCGEEECDLDQCTDEPCHCEYGMETLRQRAELRAELSREA